jgi:predicted dehydrogenase
MAGPSLSKLQVGVYGPGDVAGYHMGAYLANPYVRLAAICGRDRERSNARLAAVGLSPAKVSIYTDYHQMLETADIDLVSICVPNFMHAAAAVAAARAKKHILLEKPICLQSEEIPEMVKSVRDAGVRTVVGFRLRFSPHIARIKKWVDEGVLGQIEYLESTYILGIRSLGKSWLADQKATGDCLTVLGVHAVDLVRYLSQPGPAQDVVEVEAALDRADPELPYPSRGLVFCRLADGKLARVGADAGGLRPFHLELNVRGSAGSVIEGKVHVDGRGGLELPDIAPGDPRAGGAEYQGLIDHFVHCVREGRESHCSLMDATNTHLAVFAASRAAAASERLRVAFRP